MKNSLREVCIDDLKIVSPEIYKEKSLVQENHMLEVRILV